MKRSMWILACTVMCCGSDLYGQSRVTDPGWPRTFSNGSAELVVYQPQVDEWSGYKLLTGRCAFTLKPERNAGTVYGTFRFTADTLVEADEKLVLLRNIRAFDMRFPSAGPDELMRWAGLAGRLVPGEAIIVSLDRMLAFVRARDVPRNEAEVLMEPPPIYVSTRPAVLLMLDGEAVMVNVENTRLQRVINTNWDLYLDGSTNTYYLYAAKRWLSAASLQGPFTLAPSVPGELARQPVEEQLEGPIPRAIVVDRPSELIVVRGAPQMSPIGGTQIALVSNSESDLFFHSGTRSYYFLTSGRWFRSTTLQGPWQSATASLPDDFRRIPPEHPRAHVLAAVPGTREADDAVLLAGIPRTAEVTRAEVRAEVEYVGTPLFEPISGTRVSFARNTPGDVLQVGGLYYLCAQGVWFAAASATGPWVAADRVPEEIYSIPASSPKYHVTFVRIYATTPATVVVGYTPGYTGAYIAGGVVVWGTGYYYAPYVAAGAAAVPVYWGASCYTYGASVWYNPASGAYARGAAVYGPYGGYGAAASYNPHTGAYTRGAAVWGPNGGAAAGGRYNPSTGTYSAGHQAASPYGSWGQGVVGNGDNWARGGFQSTSRGTVAAGETSNGGRGVAVEGANGRSGYVGKSGSGDVYAGANGNVYKRDNGQWYQNQNGSWNEVDKGAAQAERSQAAARDLGNRNTQATEAWRSRGSAASGGQGVEQRPRVQASRR
ncbi:hypothetical protein [Paludibaculum fermentans]|uniref:hypothetical protein n=1 Tax=Paludibaculum fermentans TaxID=1473598 RepID=UPI003EBC9EF2